MNTEEIKQVYDKHGFRYFVKIEHKPHFGFSTAYHGDSIIAQVELGRMIGIQPEDDNDLEWEIYEERFNEWVDAIKVNIIPMCEEYFNNNYNK